MSRATITPFLGPAVVLYLIAVAAALPGTFVLSAWLIAIVALLLSASILVAQRHANVVGANRVGMFGFAVSLALVSTLQPSVGTVVSLEAVRVLAFPAVGYLLIDLALTVPEPEPSRALSSFRARWISFLPPAFGVALALIEAAPPVRFGGTALLVSSQLARAPEASAALCVGFAIAIRRLRARAGGQPEALAENAWAELGLMPAAILILAVGLVLSFSTMDPTQPWFRSALCLSAVVLVRSHVLLIDSRYRLAVGSAARRSIAVSLVVAAVSGATIALRRWIPASPLDLSLWVTAGLLGAVAMYGSLARVLRYWLAPARGALLDAIELATSRLADVGSLSDVGAAVLPPMRAASSSTDASPLLYAFDPATEVSIEAAGLARLSQVEPPQALFEQVQQHPHEIIVRRPLEDALVRRPEVRPLCDALARIDALCVVPLRNQSELEGMLVLPRGLRHASLSLEELAALDRFGALLAAFVAVLSRESRAAQRLNEVIVARDQAEQQIEVVRKDSKRRERHERALALGRLAHSVAAPITYSPKSRALYERLAQLAPVDVPVLLRTQPGTDLDPLIQTFHRHSERAEQALVVAECARLPVEQQRLALFGSDDDNDLRPGYLRLANGGTLVLVDLPALSVELQAELHQVITRKRMRPEASNVDVNVNVRWLATSRVDVPSLVAAQRFDAGLAERIAPVTLTVPSLRERREDLQSLVLRAIDSTARMHGRSELGIEADALAALLAHRFDGNEQELHAIIDRAAARCEGTRITREQLKLPRGTVTGSVTGSASPSTTSSPLSGTFDTVEKRVLKHALSQAGGNKSEAARLLGLKRTTFLDKLHRHGLDDTPPSRAES